MAESSKILSDRVLAGTMVAFGVITIYQAHMPSIAEARNASVNDGHLESARKSAAYLSAALVIGVALLLKSPEVFVIGGATLAAEDMCHKHANQVHPDTGKVAVGQYDSTSHGTAGTPYSVPYIGDGPEGYAGYQEAG